MSNEEKYSKTIGKPSDFKLKEETKIIIFIIREDNDPNQFLGIIQCYTLEKYREVKDHLIKNKRKFIIFKKIGENV